MFYSWKTKKAKKSQGKKVVDAIKDTEIKKLMSDEEAREFLKLMKNNDYGVVE